MKFSNLSLLVNAFIKYRLEIFDGFQVFLMDPWWNPAVEQQAQDRIHRLGQFKPIQWGLFLDLFQPYIKLRDWVELPQFPPILGSRGL